MSTTGPAYPYATVAQLNTWLPASKQINDQAEATRLLNRAADLIEQHVTRGWIVNDYLQPMDDFIAAALQDAVCAQVEQWLSVGEDNAIDGFPRTTQVAAGHSKLQIRGLPDVLAPRARMALQKARLTDGRAW